MIFQRKIKIGMGIALFAAMNGANAATITAIDYQGTVDPPQLLISSDAPLVIDKKENLKDKQIVLSLGDVKLPAELAKKIDTTSFNQLVMEVSPYVVEGQNQTKIAVQLRSEGTASVTVNGNQTTIVFSVATAEPSPDSAAKDDTQSDDLDGPAPTVASSKASPKADPLAEFFTARTTQHFRGRPITLRVRDMDVGDVFRLIGDASGFNIVLADAIKGKMTLSLVDVPWDQALTVVLETQHLGAERKGSILRVDLLTNLTLEKNQKIEANRVSQLSAPRVTRVFNISFAKLDDLKAILSKFIVTGAAGGAVPPDLMGQIEIDNRTNSIIVRDTVENIEKMRVLVKMLDAQTPQVLIEAKVVEASESSAKSLGGSLGFNGGGPSDIGTPYLGSFNGGNPTDGLIGTPGVFASGAGVATQSTGGGAFGISQTFSIIPGFQRLNMILNILESEQQVKTVASPRTVVLNKQKASIIQGTPVLVKGFTFQNGIQIPTDSVVSANLSLNVTPTITNDGSVLMDLNVTRDESQPVDTAGDNGVASRSLTTNVLVDSGSTLVVGGVFVNSNTHTESGFPFLRKIPIIGALFGSTSDSAGRSELFFFITPRILNTKEAGISASGA